MSVPVWGNIVNIGSGELAGTSGGRGREWGRVGGKAETNEQNHSLTSAHFPLLTSPSPSPPPPPPPQHERQYFCLGRQQ